MKSKLLGTILLLFATNFCRAQDSTVVLDTSMFDPYFQTISLASLPGWIFKQGNDTNWSKNKIDKAGWITLNPDQLTAQNADKNGRMEGWFRLKFKPDSSFKNIHVGIEALRWAAVDIYIDENYITSYGNTGLNGKPYKENRNWLTDIRRLQIEVGQVHTLAVHIVDYVAPLQRRFLKTASLDNNLGRLILLTGPLTSRKTTAFIRDRTGYYFLYCGVIGFLCLLFWLLYLQNRREKSIFLVSLSTSLFFIWILLITIVTYSFNLDFYSGWLMFFIGLQFWPLAIASMIYTVGEIFSFKYKKALLVFGIVFVGYSIFFFYFYPSGTDISLHPLTAIVLLIYIPVSSWKRLKGAQWAVVAGILLTAIFSFTSAYLYHYYQSPVFPHIYLYQSGENLSLPVSLMVYVALRFKEILTEVQVNANQVVQLSEEKKDQALKQQKILEEEVARQTIELRTSLENLKSTQAQLIHAEKMASLGQLTAGVAHEIQNPLNFVNNFSEVNKEMIDEATEGIENGNIDEVKNILNDIKENSEKINHHGKRADAIVKSMLEHSRASTGIKEPTDINKLADEYLRLAYHGMRAKDKSFEVDLQTDFDESIGKINVVPQDIGRVLLNLCNNAFYACAERSHSAVTEKHHGIVNEEKSEKNNWYQPAVWVTTKREGNSVTITVRDNGGGIPDTAKEKIFQPFFTTKPTGEGTGLGLSLSYDIIKAHGGEIKVESWEGEGSEFVIELPTKENQ